MVDDDPTFAELIRSYLADQGHKNLQVYTSGYLCLSNLYQKPDLIILDHHMDGISGLQTLQGIKAWNKEALVIVLSAETNQDFVDASLENGAFKYIQKNASAFCRIGVIIDMVFGVKEYQKIN